MGLSFEVYYECQKPLLEAAEGEELRFGIVRIRRRIWVWMIFCQCSKNLEPEKQLILNEKYLSDMFPYKKMLNRMIKYRMLMFCLKLSLCT